MIRSSLVLFVGMVSVFTAPQETPKEALDQKLRELSKLAQQVDKGEATLGEIRRKDKQPDQLMDSIRGFLHKDTRLTAKLLEFVRSEKEPLAARLMALLSVIQPSEQSLVLFFCEVLEDPPSEQVAQAVLFGFQFRRRDERGWSEILAALPSLGCGKAYAASEYDPSDREIRFGFSFANPPKGVSFQPFLSSLITLLEKDKFPALRYRVAMAHQIVGDIRLQGGDRHRLGQLLEKIYVEGREGWRTAMNILAEGREYYGMDGVDVLGNGLARLTPDQRSEVLGEVVRNRPLEAIRPPFRDYLEETLEIIGKEPKEPIGPDATLRHSSNDLRILYLLLSQSLDDRWAEKLLLRDKSVHLRRLASFEVMRACEAGNRFEVNRYSKFLESMAFAEDGIISGNARATLRKALLRKPPVFDEARAADLRRLFNW